jgi:hypothetical protein
MTVGENIGLDHGFIAYNALDRKSAPVNLRRDPFDDDPVSTFFGLHSIPPAGR